MLEQTLESFIRNYGYWAVLVGTFFEGETILVLGGFAAREGYLLLPWVILVAFIGSLSGDQFYFYLGRKHSRKIMARFPSRQIRIDRAQRLLERFQTPLLLIFRFLYGLRIAIPFAMGMSEFPAKKFFLLNALGALIWAAVIGTAGYLFGNVLEMIFGEIKHYAREILGVIAGTWIVVWVLYFRLRKKMNQRFPRK